MRYLRPKSLTWWTSIASIALGLLGMFYPGHDPIDQLGQVLAVLLGGSDSSPVGLVILGFIGIGIGDKIERKVGTHQ